MILQPEPYVLHPEKRSPKSSKDWGCVTRQDVVNVRSETLAESVVGPSFQGFMDSWALGLRV